MSMPGVISSFEFDPMAADLALRSRDIWRVILPYQPGLTQPLLDIMASHRSVQIEINVFLTTAYISNLPPRFTSLPFIQSSLNADTKLPHYALRFDNYAIDMLPLALTIIEGQETLVRQWMQCKLAWRDSNSIELAAACGRSSIISTLYDFGIDMTERAMDFAAMNGHLDLLKWFHRRGQNCTTHAMDGAASYGHLKIVEFLQNHRPEGGSAIALTRAASNGHAEIVKFLLANGYTQFDHELYTSSDPLHQGSYRVHIRKVIGNGHLEAFQLLVDHGISGFSAKAYGQLTEKGGLNAIKHLYYNNLYRVSGAALEQVVLQHDAASIDFIAARILEDIVVSAPKMLHRLPPTPLHHTPKFCHEDISDLLLRLFNTESHQCQAMDYAAYLGDLNTVILLHRLRIKCCTSQAINFACGSGHLDIAHWLNNNRMEGMGSLALTYAVATRQYNVVAWLRQISSLSYSPEALATAISHEDDTLINLVLEFPFDKMATVSDDVDSPFHHLICKEDPLFMAILKGKCHLLDRIQYNHFRALREAVLRGELDVLRYLLKKQNYACDPKLFILAIEGGRIDSLRCLMQICPGSAPEISCNFNIESHHEYHIAP